MTFLKNKNTRVLVLVMSALVFLGIIISHFYYIGINKSVDPRIIGARKLYEKYNAYARMNALDSVFSLMDTIESVYNNYSHYTNSFETGVLCNNRGAAYISMAVTSEVLDSLIRDSILQQAENEIIKAIDIYKNWINLYDSLNEDEIVKKIIPNFNMGLEGYSEKQQIKFLKNRVKEIKDAQIETKRRLSVSLTNLGIIYHNRKQYQNAALYYREAFELWEQNLTAENNLNILLDRPIKKRNLLQKLFPPKKY